MSGFGLGISPYFRRGGGSFASNFIFRTIDLGIDIDVNLVPRDGSRLIWHENKLHLIGGWNPAYFGATNDSTNEHWVNATPDDPTGWTQLADAPFDGVHIFGCVSKDGFIWKFGNDYQNAGRNSYKYSEAGGWVSVSASMTGDWGDRYFACHCLHKGKFYAAGGASTIPPGTYLTNVIESTDCINWTQVGTLPAGDYVGSILVSDGSSLYLWGGGTYISTGQNAVLKSTDNGVSWTNIGTLPADMTGTFQDGVYFEGKFWHLQGFRGGANRIGLFYTQDFVTWTQLYDNTKETHGSAFAVGNSKIYRLTGNLDNFYYSVEANSAPTTNIPSGASAIYAVFDHPDFVGDYAMEVQRSSDNTTLDIGFVGNDIDEAAMTTFMGAGDLYVSKWYDRSGNGNHATNTLGNRPRIGSGGVLDKVNGKVSVNHTSGSVRLLFDSSISLGTNHTIISVISPTTINREFIGAGLNTYLYYNEVAGSWFNSSGGLVAGSFSQVPLEQVLLTDLRNDRIYTRYLNTQAALHSAAVTANGIFTITNLSGEGNVLYNFIGGMQAVLIYPNDQSANKESVEGVLNDYFSIY